MITIRVNEREEELSLPEFEARVRAGRITADAEICFPAVTGEAWVHAGDLELFRDLAAARERRSATALADEVPPLLTGVLVGLNIRVWWMGLGLDLGSSTGRLLTNWTAPILLDGESWRLWTMGFAHTAFTHIASNLVWFVMASALLERVLGRANLFAIYMWSVMAGAVASAWFAPFQPSLGASGGVFGLIGALTVFGLRHGALLSLRQRQFFGWAMVPYVLFMLYSGTQSANTDNWAHFVGFAAGASLCFALSPTEPGHNRRIRRSMWALSLAVLITPWLVGPRIYPLLDDFAARRRIASIESPLAPPIERSSRTLSYAVPAGWRTGSSPTGLGGFVAKGPYRTEFSGWVVRESEREELQTESALYEQFVQTLQRAWPDIEVPPPTPTTLAGWPGMEVRVLLDEETVLRWAVAARGLQSLEAQWWVDPAREAKLEPLRGRLSREIRWELPPELAAAERGLRETPSPSSRRRLAQELLRVGEFDRATELLDVVLRDESATTEARAAAWMVRLRLAEVSDATLDVDAALRDATPELALAIADHLTDQSMLRRGILDLAGGRWPGHKDLRRARLREGLPARRDSDTGLPWHLVYRVDGQPIPEEERSELAARPLTLAEASRAAARLDARDTEATRLALSDRNQRLRALCYLKYRYIPDDLDAASERIRKDFARIVSGRSAPGWMPTEIVSAASDPDFTASFAAPPDIESSTPEP